MATTQARSAGVEVGEAVLASIRDFSKRGLLDAQMIPRLKEEQHVKLTLSQLRRLRRDVLGIKRAGGRVSKHPRSASGRNSTKRSDTEAVAFSKLNGQGNHLRAILDDTCKERDKALEQARAAQKRADQANRRVRDVKRFIRTLSRH